LKDWNPIIADSDELASSVWAVIRVITRSLAAQAYPSEDSFHRRHRVFEDSMFFAYLSRADADPTYPQCCVERLNSGIEAANEYDLSLFGGLSGLGWTVEHVASLLINPTDDGGTKCVIAETEDLNEQIDTALLGHLRERPRNFPFDLISGLVGFGVYFLERWPSQTACEGLALVGEQLTRRAEHSPDGATWLTEPRFLPDWQRADSPNGHYDLGVAHGIPGVLYLLAQLAMRIKKNDSICELLDGGLRWLLAQRNQEETRNCGFPSWMYHELRGNGTKPVWCYGDLGVGAMLLQIARELKRPPLYEAGRDLIARSLDFSADESLVKDAALCHGATGIAHIYNRLFHFDGNPRYRDAALLWFRRAIRDFRPGTGVGGYSRYAMHAGAEKGHWEPNPTFLNGAIGIGLALLASVSPIEPRWDRLLLLSSAPQ